MLNEQMMRLLLYITGPGFIAYEHALELLPGLSRKGFKTIHPEIVSLFYSRPIPGCDVPNLDDVSG